MFVVNPDGELSQVELWSLYRDTFSPFQEQYSLLAATDVIRNVHVCFPQAQATVLQPSQKFVVRGVERVRVALYDRFKCLWNRSQCPEPTCSSACVLFEHLLEHISGAESAELPCLLANCSQGPLPKAQLRAHILTHLPSAESPSISSSQSDSITLSGQNREYPLADPTMRLPPPPPSATVSYQVPKGELPPGALTALLCVRVLFKTAFAESEEAPKVDEDHFGFPGVLPEEDPEAPEAARNVQIDGEGQARGKRAFARLRHLMENIQIQDEALMSWMAEMVMTCSMV
jgi:chromatin structure-remodeling complex subunit RSC9